MHAARSPCRTFRSAPYRVEFVHDGFKTHVRNDVIVTAGATKTFAIQMVRGSMAEVVVGPAESVIAIAIGPRLRRALLHRITTATRRHLHASALAVASARASALASVPARVDPVRLVASPEVCREVSLAASRCPSSLLTHMPRAVARILVRRRTPASRRIHSSA